MVQFLAVLLGRAYKLHIYKPLQIRIHSARAWPVQADRFRCHRFNQLVSVHRFRRQQLKESKLELPSFKKTFAFSPSPKASSSATVAMPYKYILVNPFLRMSSALGLISPPSTVIV